MKKMPKERKIFTKHHNAKRMYSYLSENIEEELQQNSPSAQQDIASFEQRMQSDKQTYSTKAKKQGKFAKWGAIIGFAGSIALMSLAFFIFGWGTAILPGTFLIRTGILLGASLLSFGLIPAWLAHRSRKIVKLAEKYEDKLHKAQQHRQQVLTDTDTQEKAKAQVEAKSNITLDTNQETLEDALTLEPTVDVSENKEQSKEETHGVASFDVVSNPQNPDVIEVETIDKQLDEQNESVDTYVNNQDSTISFDESQDGTYTVDESQDSSNDDSSSNNGGSNDNSNSSSNDGSNSGSNGGVEEAKTATTSHETVDDQTVITAKPVENAEEQTSTASAPSKVGRYKFEIISTHANKKGKGKIKTKVVAFSANSQEAFLEKMRKFTSNNSKARRSLNTEVEQANWLFEGKYPTTLQFRVTDIFHPNREFVSPEYNNGLVSAEGKKQDIQTFVSVVDSLRRTWSKRLVSAKQQVQEQKETAKAVETKQAEQKVQDEFSDEVATTIDNHEENQLNGTSDEFSDEIVDAFDSYEENELLKSSAVFSDDIVDALDSYEDEQLSKNNPVTNDSHEEEQADKVEDSFSNELVDSLNDGDELTL